MWTYNFEVPILMILSIMMLFYFSRARLPIRKNRVFVIMIVVEMMTILTDVAASAADMDHSSYDIRILSVLNALYFVFFFTRAYFMYLFAACVMKDVMEKRAVCRILISLPACIGVLLSVFSVFAGSASFPYVIFYVDEYGYHSGSLYNILYIFGLFYVLLSFISSYLFRKSFGRIREKYYMLLYNSILLASLVIRWLFPNYLLMDTFIFMAILVVYLAFENPEFYLTLRGYAFNVHAYPEFLEEGFSKRKWVTYGVAIHNYPEMRDIYGTVQMEAALTMIARYLKSIFKKGGIFYLRDGGFVIVSRPVADFEDVCKKINERFKKPWRSRSMEVYLSAGFAEFEPLPEGYAAESIQRTATKALESISLKEDDGILKVTEEDIIKTEAERKVRHCLETALEGEGFELFLQPIVDAGTGKLKGAEALSRIRDEEGRIMPPGIFLPVAESSGRIHKLGELVFERTCRFIKEEDIEGMGVDFVNVNLSPSQFIRTDLAERYLAIAGKYGIDPSQIHLEITESSMIDDCFLQKQVGALRERGFEFVLDDYGTGYSNLARLKKCPFINIKLDMSIVRDYCREPDEILPNMVDAFKHMGFRVTAEGIEDEKMEKTMRDTGCDLFQGYHYSKPVPEAEFIRKYL